MIKKKIEIETKPFAAPAYMVTYGDMITLILCFFVLLSTFSTVQPTKFSKAMGSLRSAFGYNKSELKQNAILDQLNQMNERKIDQKMSSIQAMAKEMKMQESITIDKNDNYIHIRISEPVLFDSGSALLKENSLNIMKLISVLISEVPFEVRIEGHTDNLPLKKNSKYLSNWELSSARALSVAEVMIQEGNQPSRFQVVGYGEYRPIADNKTDSGKNKNRRVEIYISKFNTQGILFTK